MKAVPYIGLENDSLSNWQPMEAAQIALPATKLMPPNDPHPNIFYRL